MTPADDTPFPGRLDREVSLTPQHRVLWERGVLVGASPVLGELLAECERCLCIIDRGFWGACPTLHPAIEKQFRHRLLLTGGEAAKNSWHGVEQVLAAIHEHNICRRSAVVVIGGGAVLDAAGFAAAIAHRGVRLIRIPTTTLSQCDSGVGVKNGINAFGKKNFLGSFAVPYAVINDPTLLRALPDDAWRAGMSEAVKVALLKSPALYAEIDAKRGRIRRRDEAACESIWQASAQLHYDHITRGGDPFETEQARPLDFGHWAAHKLEAMTDHRISHGDAVAIGLTIDLTYAALVGLMPPGVAVHAIDLLRAIGFHLQHPAMRDVETLLVGIEEFREHLGGELTITLVQTAGQPIDVHTINRDMMVTAIRLAAHGQTSVPAIESARI